MEDVQTGIETHLTLRQADDLPQSRRTIQR